MHIEKKNRVHSYS